MKRNIIYLAYGDSSLYNQVIASILSLYQFIKNDLGNYRIIIYTDKPAAFDWLKAKVPLSFEVLTRSKLKVYKGDRKFELRVKICIVKDTFSKYEGDVIFFDSDTFFIGDPTGKFAKIDENHSLMWEKEYSLKDTGSSMVESLQWLYLRKLSRESSFILRNHTINIPLSAEMWNSGVIGISYTNSHLLDDVLSLNDQIYAKAPVFIIEQFAFSYILQVNTALASLKDSVDHYYWKEDKHRYNYHLKDFFKINANLPIEQLSIKMHEFIGRRWDLVQPEKKKLSLIEKANIRLKLLSNIVQIIREGKVH